MLIRNAELDYGRRITDLRIRDGVIAEIGAELTATADEEAFDARGCAVVPGLHDHHIHLYALAASLRSVHCGPPAVSDEISMRDALNSAAVDEGGWIRADAYHESVAGPLDRKRLDELRDDLPLRVQHRSGAMWFFNTRALKQLGADTDTAKTPPGLERDRQGRATGRLFRGDAWLRERLDNAAVPDLSAVGRLLACFGITGCTDATASNGKEEFAALEAAQRSKALPVDLRVMGRENLSEIENAEGGIRPGALKILLDDIALPTIDDLAARMAAVHERNRSVAVHCVTRTQLLLALAAWKHAGVLDGDRIEHGSVCPPETIDDISACGLRVITQPIFVRDRGDAYLTEVDPGDLPSLYRCRSLADAGILLAAGSDAPYGDPDPWKAIKTATDRSTAAGVVLGEPETLDPERALELFTSALAEPGSAPRRVSEGSAADLCVLNEPWSVARENLSHRLVRTTIRAGDPTCRNDNAGS